VCRGGLVGAIDRFAYPDLPDEVQLLWWKALAPQRRQVIGLTRAVFSKLIRSQVRPGPELSDPSARVELTIELEQNPAA
jgi:hypothetical protein